MSDRLAQILLRLYPEEFRTRFGPQIMADFSHPETNRVAALFDICQAGLRARLATPGPYIWITAFALAAMIITVSGTITLRGSYRLLQPRFDTAAQLYALLFLAVFLVLTGVLVLAIHWLQTYRRITAPCSKSRT